ncbi:hypothetical protein KFE25_006561 [Diacronema lutheri]|uniref:JmjC domain-containing protein n=3 Tax=Diacronema lutheri TaxID=2081491 RepID=A0A8J5X5S7_DIALT|nr:hypothetical protein KFE25_006561 [Diacronema lutheri]
MARRAIVAAQRAARLGASEPVRLELPVARAWVASGAWTADALAADMAAAASHVEVKASARGLFMLVEGGGDDARTPASHRFDLERVSTREFWRRLGSAPRGASGSEPRVYLTGDPAALCPRAAASLASSAAPGGALGALTLDAGVAPSPPSLWLSSEGCVTVTHYDSRSNLLVQLLGEKTVELWPPLSAAELRVYPDSHARARKSQLDVGGPAARAPPLPPPLYTVRLCAGQALHIPPFFFHRVATSSAPRGSASLNAFSRCALSAAAEALLAPFAPHALPLLPVHPRWPRETVVLPALAHVLARVHAEMRAALVLARVRAAGESGAAAEGDGGLAPLDALLHELVRSRFGDTPLQPQPQPSPPPSLRETDGGADARLAEQRREAAEAADTAAAEAAAAAAEAAARARRAKRRRGEAAALLAPPPPPPPLRDVCARVDAFLGFATDARVEQPVALDLRAACAEVARRALRAYDGEPGGSAPAGPPAAARQERAYQLGVAQLLVCHIAESLVVSVLGRGAGGARDGDGVRDLLAAVRDRART